MVAVFVISGSTTMSLAESKLMISDDEDINFGPFDSDTSASVPSGMEQLSSAQPTHGELLADRQPETISHAFRADAMR